MAHPHCLGKALDADPVQPHRRSTTQWDPLARFRPMELQGFQTQRRPVGTPQVCYRTVRQGQRQVDPSTRSSRQRGAQNGPRSFQQWMGAAARHQGWASAAWEPALLRSAPEPNSCQLCDQEAEAREVCVAHPAIASLLCVSSHDLMTRASRAQLHAVMAARRALAALQDAAGQDVAAPLAGAGTERRRCPAGLPRAHGHCHGPPAVTAQMRICQDTAHSTIDLSLQQCGGTWLTKTYVCEHMWRCWIGREPQNSDNQNLLFQGAAKMYIIELPSAVQILFSFHPQQQEPGTAGQRRYLNYLDASVLQHDLTCILRM